MTRHSTRSCVLEAREDPFDQLPVLLRVRRVVVVELDVEAAEVAQVFFPDAFDQRFGRDA